MKKNWRSSNYIRPRNSIKCLYCNKSVRLTDKLKKLRNQRLDFTLHCHRCKVAYYMTQDWSKTILRVRPHDNLVVRIVTIYLDNSLVVDMYLEEWSATVYKHENKILMEQLFDIPMINIVHLSKEQLFSKIKKYMVFS